MSILIVCSVCVFERAQASAQQDSLAAQTSKSFLMLAADDDVHVNGHPALGRAFFNKCALSDETKEDSICSAKSKIGSQ